MGSVPEATMKPLYMCKKMKTKPEMDAIMDVIWAANYDPYDTYVQLFFPVLGYTPSARTAALAEAGTRLWQTHTASPASNWYYIEETATGNVVGCAQWEEHRENPFKEGAPAVRAPWWPEGAYRDFCEEIMRQAYLPRASWLRRPHMALNWMAVRPTHRRKGVGSLLMKVGTQRADELGVECWMEATSMGKPLYEQHGFRSLLKIEYDTDRKDASDVWRKCVHELTPTPFFAMWRPKGGAWEVEGKSIRMPWAHDGA